MIFRKTAQTFGNFSEKKFIWLLSKILLKFSKKRFRITTNFSSGRPLLKDHIKRSQKNLQNEQNFRLKKFNIIDNVWLIDNWLLWTYFTRKFLLIITLQTMTKNFFNTNVYHQQSICLQYCHFFKQYCKSSPSNRHRMDWGMEKLRNIFVFSKIKCSVYWTQTSPINCT